MCCPLIIFGVKTVVDGANEKTHGTIFIHSGYFQAACQGSASPWSGAFWDISKINHMVYLNWRKLLKEMNIMQ